MCLKINWFVKTPWHGPGMVVARSGLWAPVRRLWFSGNYVVGVASRRGRTKPITKRRYEHCDWFIFLLLLPTPIIWFSLHRGTSIQILVFPTVANTAQCRWSYFETGQPVLKPTDFFNENKAQARDQENRKEAVLPLLVRSFLFGSDSLFSPLTEKGRLAV